MKKISQFTFWMHEKKNSTQFRWAYLLLNCHTPKSNTMKVKLFRQPKYSFVRRFHPMCCFIRILCVVPFCLDTNQVELLWWCIHLIDVIPRFYDYQLKLSMKQGQRSQPVNKCPHRNDFIQHPFYHYLIIPKWCPLVCYIERRESNGIIPNGRRAKMEKQKKNTCHPRFNNESFNECNRSHHSFYGYFFVK